MHSASSGSIALALAGTLAFAAAPHSVSAKPTPQQIASVVVVNASVPTPVAPDDGHGGSGFVVAPGMVVTNAHVVVGPGFTNFQIVTSDGAVWRANPIWVDQSADIALLQVPGLKVPPLKLARKEPEQGEAIWAVGYPGASLELQEGNGVPRSTLTNGILSAQYPMRISAAARRPVPVLQHNAAISPGNSGGPLLNDCGAVVGINTLLATKVQGVFIASSIVELRRLLVTSNPSVTPADAPDCDAPPAADPSKSPPVAARVAAAVTPGELGWIGWVAIGLAAVAALGAAAFLFVARPRRTRPAGAAAGSAPTSGGALKLSLTPVGSGDAIRPLSEDLVRRHGWVLGRSSLFVDHAVADMSVSRRHVRIAQLDGKLKIEDLGSRYGTLLDGQKLDPFKPVALASGQTLAIGNLQFRIGIT